MIVLDTNILSYALGDDHPLRDHCRRLLQAHRDGRVEATTTVEVLQEFTHVRARRRSRADAARSARAYAAAFTLLHTAPEDLELGLQLFEQHRRLGAFDAVLAAVALNHRAEALVSADRAFGEVVGLRLVEPGTISFDRLLAR